MSTTESHERLISSDSHVTVTHDAVKSKLATRSTVTAARLATSSAAEVSKPTARPERSGFRALTHDQRTTPSSGRACSSAERIAANRTLRSETASGLAHRPHS